MLLTVLLIVFGTMGVWRNEIRITRRRKVVGESCHWVSAILLVGAAVSLILREGGIVLTISGIITLLIAIPVGFALSRPIEEQL